jgi:hypothetical protein
MHIKNVPEKNRKELSKDKLAEFLNCENCAKSGRNFPPVILL